MLKHRNVNGLAAFAIFAILASGCNFNLISPPSQPQNSALPQPSLTATSGTASPTQQISLSASGGTPPYQFSIGQNHSGAGVSATGASTATYTAGIVSNGSDVVTLQDSNGQIATASIVVTPGPADHFLKVSGDALSTPVNHLLSSVIKVQLLDQWGNVVAGQSVGIMQVEGFDSQIQTPPIVSTDANGFAQFQVQAGVSRNEILQVIPLGGTLANVSAVSQGKAPVFKETTVATGNGTFLQRYYPIGPSADSDMMGSADFRGNGRTDLAVVNSFDNTVSILLSNGDGTFQSQVVYGVGAEPTSIVIADFNKDGKPDIAVNNYNSNNISVLINHGDGTFAAAVSYGTGSYTNVGITAGDYNGDGNIDIIASNNGNMGILLGNGNGTFQAATTFSGPNYGGYYLQTADLNGDGKADIVFVDGDNYLQVMTGNGNGTFTAKYNYSIGSLQGDPVIYDLNGDGKLDLIVPEYSNSRVSVFIGNGDGTFQAPVNYSVGANPTGLVLGDFNGDGKIDIANVGRGGTMSILLGKGDGTFNAATTSSVSALYAIAKGDFNGDGKTDLAIASGTNAVVFIGNGDGTFQSPGATTLTTASANFSKVQLADLNKDGKLDSIALDTNNNQISVLLGNGDGTFQAQANYPLNSGQDFALGDFNGDGVLDILVEDSGSIGILLGKGDGTFSLEVSFNSGITPSGIVVGDFNHDGKLDVAYADQNLSGYGVLLGNGDGTFQGALTTVLLNTYVTSISAGDFNGDGVLDLTVADGNNNQLYVLLGNGDGTFNDTGSYPPIGWASKMYAGDFDGNGMMDLLVFSSGSASVMLGNGDGTFQSAASYGSGAGDFTLGDFNGDGRMDLAFATGSTVQVLFGNANGSFQSAVTFTANASSIATGNINGSGKLSFLLGGSQLSYLPAN